MKLQTFTTALSTFYLLLSPCAAQAVNTTVPAPAGPLVAGVPDTILIANLTIFRQDLAALRTALGYYHGACWEYESLITTPLKNLQEAMIMTRAAAGNVGRMSLEESGAFLPAYIFPFVVDHIYAFADLVQTVLYTPQLPFQLPSRKIQS
jgi:hypothetical protein